MHDFQGIFLLKYWFVALQSPAQASAGGARCMEQSSAAMEIMFRAWPSG
jgi:hypothetical protein